MAERVLLLGSSFSAMPLLMRLKRSGLRVEVCGAYRDDPCHRYADRSHFINYADKEALLTLCKKERFDFIVPSCNDYAYNAASYVSQNMGGHPGFDPYEITMTLHTKDRFRALTALLNLPAPQGVSLGPEDPHAKALSLRIPLLVKPIDSFSGKGISRVEKIEQLDAAIHQARSVSPTEKVVVEEFLEGELFSHSAFLCDGKIDADYFVREYCTVYPYQVDSSCIAYDLSPKIQEGMRKAVETLAAHLGLTDGLIHTQFLADGESFGMIEVMRRCPGDLYGSLIERATGFDYTGAYLSPFVAGRIERKNCGKIVRYVARHTVSVDRPTVFRSVEVAGECRDFNIVPLKNSGEPLKPAPADKAAIVFLEFGSEEKVLRFVPHPKESVRVGSYQETMS